MTEKQYKKSILRVIKTGVIDENNNELNTDEVVALLNEQEEYQQKVKETLQKRYAQLDRITKRYGSMHKPCKDLLSEICKELGVEIDD